MTPSRVMTVLHVAVLAAAAAALFGLRLAVPPLIDPDESRCALVVRQMLDSGDWITPQLRDEPYYDKPAPFFWLAAAGQRLTGSLEAGGRLVAALAAFAALCVTYFFARSLAGPAAGLLAALVLATSGMFLFLARFYRMDMPFVAFQWSAIAWFWRCERAGGPEQPRRPATVRWGGFYALCGLATLMKGPAGAGLPVLIVAAWLIGRRQWRRLGELFHPLGLAAYFAVAAPWYVAVQIRNPDFARVFFLQENWQRFTGSGHAHHWAHLIYVPILLGGLMPWTIMLPWAAARAARPRRLVAAAAPGLGLAWSAMLVPLVFFSLSGTKLAHYIAPCFPPLAVLIGICLARWVRGADDGRIVAVGVRITAAVLAAAVASLGVAEWKLGVLDAWFAAAAAVAVAGTAAAVYWAGRRRAAALAAVLLAIAVTSMRVDARAAPAVCERYLCHRELGLAVARQASPGAVLCYWGDRRYSFPLYAGHAGATRYDPKRPEALPELADLFRSDAEVYCLVSDSKLLSRLTAACDGRIRVVGKDTQGYWLATNRPAAGQPASASSIAE